MKNFLLMLAIRWAYDLFLFIFIWSIIGANFYTFSCFGFTALASAIYQAGVSFNKF